ncbi:MAG: UvrD-helicase domain-containing protein [Endomicrobiales bacterium]
MAEFLDKLNPKQKEAVLHIDQPLIIFAGAGTGKTRVITCRIAHLLGSGVSPWQILAVTFTNKAAEEMRRRVDELAAGQGRGVWISTYHSFGAQFLRVEAKQIGLNPEFLIYDTNDQKHVIKDVIELLNLSDKTYKPSRIIELISRAKDDLLDADSYAIHALASGDNFRQTAAAIYEIYQKKLNQAGALDFGDLIMRTVMALRDNTALREKYQERFKYVLVDEYQDTNHGQYLLTKYLSAKHKNICVVGDDDQSVYSWRGADIRNILEFERDYPGCRMIKLEQNYRSTPNILNTAWQVVQRNQKRVEKKLWTNNSEGETVQLIEARNELDEAQDIVYKVQSLTRKYGYKRNDFAVFYRTNAQSRVLEDAFRREGIPYAVIGTMRFYERAEIKDVLAYLKLIHNPHDNVSFKRVVNVPRRGIGKATIDTLDQLANEKNCSIWQAMVMAGDKKGLTIFRNIIEELRALKDAHTVKEITALVLEKTRFVEDLKSEDTIESRSRVENIYELMSAIDEFETRSPDKTLAGYLTQVSLVNDIDEWSEETDRVTLMTLHLAKGLEFKSVFVTGLEEGLFPIGDAAFDESDLEEERRLMYVGMTRAKEHLYLSWAAERRVYGKTRWNLPSRFIAEAGLQTEPREQQNENRYRHSVKVSNVPPDNLNENETSTPASVSAPTDNQEDHSLFKIGSRVLHQMFGPGKIIDRSGAGDDLKLVVVFDTGQWKKLLAKYANLQQID